MSESIKRFLLCWWIIVPLKYFCLKLCCFRVIFICIYDSCCGMVNFSEFQSYCCWLLFRMIMRLWNDYEVAIWTMVTLFFCCCNFLSYIFENYKVKWYFDERVWLWFLFCPESLILVEFWELCGCKYMCF